MSVELLPGQYFDGETNLHYNWFRYYDPSLGRFLRSDPIRLDDGPNTHAYVGNNPLTYYDFLGLARQVQFSISGTAQAGFPQLAFFGAGIGGGTTFTLSIPDDWTNWRCYQAGLSGQLNLLGGVGVFVGIGATVGTTTSDGPLESGLTSSSSIYTEGNIGWVAAGGVNFTGPDGSSVTSWEDWVGPVDSYNVTPDPRIGVGFGASAGVGQYYSGGWTSKTLGSYLSSDSSNSCGCE